jgi:hypothetical protein
MILVSKALFKSFEQLQIPKSSHSLKLVCGKKQFWHLNHKYHEKEVA